MVDTATASNDTQTTAEMVISLAERVRLIRSAGCEFLRRWAVERAVESVGGLDGVMLEPPVPAGIHKSRRFIDDP